MKRIFAPAIAALNRLPYVSKFVLVGPILIAPLTITLYLLVSELNTDITHAKKEVVGLEYSVSMRRLLENMQQHRGMSSAFLSGDVPFKEMMISEQARINEDIELINAIDRNYRISKITTEELGTIAARWRGLSVNVWNMSGMESFNAHTSLIDDLLSAMSHIADVSELVLDRQLDSYYMIDVLVNKVPRLTENMGQARAIGSGIAARGTITDEEKQEIIARRWLINASLEASKNGLQTVFRENPGLLPKLGQIVKGSEEAAKTALNLLDNNFIMSGRIAITPADYYAAMTMSIKANFSLYDGTASELKYLLEARLEQLLTKKTIAWSIAAFAMLLVTYIFSVFYLSIVPPMHRLVAAIRGMASGHYDRNVTIESSDEIGIVGTAFNDMTNAINRKIAQLAAMQEAVSDIVSNLEMEPLLQTLAHRASILTQAELSALVVLHPVKGNVEFFKANIQPEGISELTMPSFRGLLGVVLKDAAPLRIPDVKNDTRFAGLPPGHPEIKRIMGVPLLFQGRVIGELLVANRKDGKEFTQEDEDLLLTLAFHSVAAIENARLHKAITEMAIMDELTGLNNRRHFDEHLREEVERSTRFNHPFSLMMIDIDFFKKVNDTYGHPAGDAVLKQLAGILVMQTRSADFTARYGGEEFVAVLPETIEKGAVEIAERHRVAIEKNGFLLPDGREINITASIGIAGFPTCARSGEKLVEMADQALYAAKQAGRNRVCIFQVKDMRKVDCTAGG